MRIPAKRSSRIKPVAIVLTEDNDFQVRAEKVLSNYGYSSITMHDLLKLAEKKLDVVLLDVMFPSLLSSQQLLDGIKKQKIPIVLASKNIKELESFPFTKIQVQKIISKTHFLSSLSQFLLDKSVDPRTIDTVLFDSTKKCFNVTFKDGKSFSLDRNLLQADDGTTIINAVVIDKGYAFKVKQKSGNIYEISWDNVYYFCNPAYEYYYKKSSLTPTIPSSKIGKRIKELREKRHLNITKVAACAGLKRPNLSRIEHGKVKPSLDTLTRIADALNVPVADLITR